MIFSDLTFEGDTTRPDHDHNAHWVAENGSRYHRCIFNANAVAEAVKLSSRENVEFHDCVFVGGYEDCADLVNCSYVKFVRCKFHGAKSRQHITCKGTSTGVQFDHCQFYGTPTHGTVIDLGQHVKRSSNLGGYTRAVTVADCIVHSPALSLVRSWKARKISTARNRGAYRIRHLWLPIFVWWPYFFLRDRGVI